MTCRCSRPATVTLAIVPADHRGKWDGLRFAQRVRLCQTCADRLVLSEAGYAIAVTP